MLTITSTVRGCKKSVCKDIIVDLDFPRQIGKNPDPMESRQMCPDARVLWPVQLKTKKTRRALEQHGGVKYAEVVISCIETNCIFHEKYKKGNER